MNSLMAETNGIDDEPDKPELCEFSIKITGRVAEIVHSIAALRNCTTDDVVLSSLQNEYAGLTCDVGHALNNCDDEIKRRKEKK